MEDDLRKPIHELGGNVGQSIVSHLLKFQESQIRQSRSFDWAKTLTCLSTNSLDLNGGTKILQKIPVSIASGDYVAVSYKWDNAQLDRERTGGYLILSEDAETQTHSAVSDVVLSRVLKYTNAYSIPALWIDQECIDQEDPVALENATQSMDLVYRCSNHPVGVLMTRLKRQYQLDLLYVLMAGKLTVHARPRLAHHVDSKTLLDVLRLLAHLTSDPWWTRRWIFQEEYCSYRPTNNKTMQLLIPHNEGLSKTEWDRRSNFIEGEVIVDVAKLRTRATLFFLACQRSKVFQTDEELRICDDILTKLKSYKILHAHNRSNERGSSCRPMSRDILSDISRRNVTKPGDTLAILANCCGYTVRLDRHKLEARGSLSLSLAMLSLCILNGEILWTNERASPEDTVLQFLESQTFDEFAPPVETKQLSFMKKTRLTNVRLVEDGIRTTGHLWTIRPEKIRTSTFHLRLSSRLDNEEASRQCLRRLVAELMRLSFKALARNVRRYLQDIVPSHVRSASGLTQVFDDTATTLAAAIASGETLVVAQHITNKSCWGIFICNWDFDDRFTPGMIFTASQSAEYNELVEMYETPGKYVSLAVDCNGFTDDGLALLKVKGWVNGLTFPGSTDDGAVLFRWPHMLLETLIMVPNTTNDTVTIKTPPRARSLE